MTSKENPIGQNAMAQQLRISQATVSRLIHSKLGKTVRRKKEVHVLSESHKKNRKTNSRKLYEAHLAGKKTEFVATLDEAFFSISDCNGSRKIYYDTEGKGTSKYVKVKRESFGKKFMVVGVMTGRGTLPLIKVPPKVKINSDYYIGKVLRPILETGIPTLYGSDTDKVFIHHDKASSHTSKKTQDYTTEINSRLGITVISNKDIPVKSPDVSPLDFFGFGYLKQQLFRRRATTLDGVWKVLKEEWAKITPEKCQNVFQAWKRRLRVCSKLDGEHIEHTRQIHKRKV
jgi:predicted transcriptional regulator